MRERLIGHLKDHFIPHAGNNHHPHVLRHHILAGYSAIFVLLKVLAVIIAASFPSASLYSSSITPANIISLTNATREALHLPLLSTNGLLAQAAQRKANDMLAKQYFAHRSPNGQTALDLIEATGYKPLYAGENLAVHFLTAEDVNSGWMMSPTHRANIVNARYDEIGIGIANGDFEGEATQFVVQLFGKKVEHLETPIQKPIPAQAPQTKPEPTTKLATETIQSKVTRTPTGYRVKVTVPKTTHSVSVAVAQNQTVLEAQTATTTTSTSNTSTQEFIGSVDVDTNTLPPSGETINAIVRLPDGQTEQIPLAVISPKAQLGDVYLFQKPTGSAKVLGFAVSDLEDGIHKTYLYFIIFIGFSFILGLTIRSSRIRHLSVATHTLGVLLFAAILFAI